MVPRRLCPSRSNVWFILEKDDPFEGTLRTVPALCMQNCLTLRQTYRTRQAPESHPAAIECSQTQQIPLTGTKRSLVLEALEQREGQVAPQQEFTSIVKG